MERDKMYDWLEHELMAVLTPGFHVVEGPAAAELREAVSRSVLPLPDSYRAFVLRFGNAKLYRIPRTRSYRIGVFAGPRRGRLDDGTPVFEVGFHDGARVFIDLAAGPTGGAVWESEAGEEQRVGESFHVWLADRCARARARHTVDEWAVVVSGPKPFTPAEQELIDTRRHISWRVTGIDADGNHVFEVTNAGTRSIPVLTVGVRSEDRRLNGAILLAIGHIGPGQTATVRASCYKGLKRPEEILVFELPEPRPEDRDFYGELHR